jgi:D-alanyl-D-alanine dipeptidase
VLRVGALIVVLVGQAAAAPKPGDLIDVAAEIPDAVIDLRYATKDNFTKAVLYPIARCKLRRAVVERLVKAAATLRKKDRRLLIWDCYRPLSIQKALWKKVPDPRYVADPATGSKHNRGAAIDLAVVDKAGKPVLLPTAFDEFTQAAHRDRAFAGPKGKEAKALSEAMHAAGFTGIPTEWWHFDASDAANYALSDQPL